MTMISEYPICKCGCPESQHFTTTKMCVNAYDKVDPCHCTGFEAVPKEHIKIEEGKI